MYTTKVGLWSKVQH